MVQQWRYLNKRHLYRSSLNRLLVSPVKAEGRSEMLCTRAAWSKLDQIDALDLVNCTTVTITCLCAGLHIDSAVLTGPVGIEREGGSGSVNKTSVSV